MQFQTLVDTTADPNEAILFGDDVVVVRQTARDGRQWFEVSQDRGVPALTAAEWMALVGMMAAATRKEGVK